MCKFLGKSLLEILRPENLQAGGFEISLCTVTKVFTELLAHARAAWLHDRRRGRVAEELHRFMTTTRIYRATCRVALPRSLAIQRISTYMDAVGHTAQRVDIIRLVKADPVVKRQPLTGGHLFSNVFQTLTHCLLH